MLTQNIYQSYGIIGYQRMSFLKLFSNVPDVLITNTTDADVQILDVFLLFVRISKWIIYKEDKDIVFNSMLNAQNDNNI